MRGSLSVRWAQHVKPHAAQVLAVNGRMRFIHPDREAAGTAPFESVLVVFDADHDGSLTLGAIGRNG